MVKYGTVWMKTSKIYQLISLGDKLMGKNRLKEAFLSYSSARKVATNYNKDLISYCNGKIRLLHDIASQVLNDKLEITIKKIENLFLAERFTEIKPVTKDFINFLKAFKWPQISEIFEEFQCIMLDYWEVIFPKLFTLADGYYDNKQYRQAIVMFTICKGVVKELKFGPERAHLIEAFMRYEMECNINITIAEMYKFVAHAQVLMDSNQKQEALVPLSAADNLESEIPTQFRDKKRLRDLCFKKNQLRKDYYK